MAIKSFIALYILSLDDRVIKASKRGMEMCIHVVREVTITICILGVAYNIPLSCVV